MDPGAIVPPKIGPIRKPIPPITDHPTAEMEFRSVNCVPYAICELRKAIRIPPAAAIAAPSENA